MSIFGIFCIGSAVNTSQHAEEEDAAGLPDFQPHLSDCLIAYPDCKIARAKAALEGANIVNGFSLNSRSITPYI